MMSINSHQEDDLPNQLLRDNEEDERAEVLTKIRMNVASEGKRRQYR